MYTDEAQLRKAEEEQDLSGNAAGESASISSILQNRSFRLLWIGEAISLVGDQFYLIALPWLVLKLTGDGLAVGLILALAGIPRAIFMVVGGAFTDRFSPRTIMLVSNLARMILIIGLAFLVMSDLVAVWMLYLLALAFGLMDAFFYPAQTAIVPRLVKEDRLQTANAIMQGTMQLSLFAGPILAGYLIAFFGSRQEGGDLRGIGLAFLIDALTFLASAITLWFLKDPSQADTTASFPSSSGLSSAIREGLETVWQDSALRAFFLLIALSNFLINGPLIIGIPVLADIRYAGGAASFGMIMSAYGGGSLLGTLLAGLLPQPPAKRMGIILGVIWSGLGLGIVSLGLISSTAVAASATFLMGLAQGYVVILFITWLQRRTKESMLGRMMSLLMLASVGLQPVSYLLTGALIGLNASALFVTAGSLMALIVMLFMLNPNVRSMELPPVQKDALNQQVGSVSSA